MAAVELFGVIALGALCLYALVIVLIIVADIVQTRLREHVDPDMCPYKRRICGDTTLCDCGETWDTNDMYPPEGH